MDSSKCAQRTKYLNAEKAERQIIMDNILFKGTMPALITPFDKNGKILKNTVNQLVDWHLSEGSKGFYICGSTGEGPALQASTRMEMAEAALDAVKGRGVVIDHIGAPNIWDAIALTEHATKIGVSAISSLAPTYSFKYTEDELFNYYKTIADHTTLPVIVYATAAMQVANFPKLMAKLMDIPNVIGVKCTLRDYFVMRKVKEVNGGNINLINGPDETLLCGLVMGADGGIGTTYNVMPGWFARIYDAFTAGDLATAQEYQYKANHVIDALIRFGKNGAINSTKAALNLMGYDAGHAVFPGREFTKDELASFKKELQELGIEF